MKTRIEIYEIARPANIVASGCWSRKLRTQEIRKEIAYMMRHLDAKKFTHRIVEEE
ncbi:hypothetical protein [Alistipes communis]|jgi:hypothetical protein|uniref:hypothetical protein n=1 Tax=Alistipes communis TaxID=2585118 RepID=UPI00351F8B33